MDWFEKIDIDKIVFCIKENMKIISLSGIIIIIGFILLMCKLGTIKTETDTMCSVVQKWYAQLPEEHWVKDKSDMYFEHDFFEYQLLNLYEQLKIYSHTFFEISYVSMSQKGMAGRFFGKAMQTADKLNEKKYYLVNNEGKKIRKIKLDVGEEYPINFYYDEIQMLLDFTEQDYINEITNFKSGTISIANRIAFSYSDNPEVAKIDKGNIVGISKGETTINIACNGYFFSYDIKVK